MPKDETFNVQKHIEKSMARLSPSKMYFTLTDVTTAKSKKEKKLSTPKPNEDERNGLGI